MKKTKKLNEEELNKRALNAYKQGFMNCASTYLSKLDIGCGGLVFVAKSGTSVKDFEIKVVTQMLKLAGKEDNKQENENNN